MNCQLSFKLTDRERSGQEGSRSSSLNLFHGPKGGTLAELRGSLGLGGMGLCVYVHSNTWGRGVRASVHTWSSLYRCSECGCAVPCKTSTSASFSGLGVGPGLAALEFLE